MSPWEGTTPSYNYEGGVVGKKKVSPMQTFGRDGERTPHCCNIEKKDRIHRPVGLRKPSLVGGGGGSQRRYLNRGEEDDSSWGSTLFIAERLGTEKRPGKIFTPLHGGGNRLYACHRTEGRRRFHQFAAHQQAERRGGKEGQAALNRTATPFKGKVN